MLLPVLSCTGGRTTTTNQFTRIKIVGDRDCDTIQSFERTEKTVEAGTCACFFTPKVRLFALEAQVVSEAVHRIPCHVLKEPSFRLVHFVMLGQAEILYA